MQLIMSTPGRGIRSGSGIEGSRISRDGRPIAIKAFSSTVTQKLYVVERGLKMNLKTVWPYCDVKPLAGVCFIPGTITYATQQK
jgi:hypothetical protein